MADMNLFADSMQEVLEQKTLLDARKPLLSLDERVNRQ